MNLTNLIEVNNQVSRRIDTLLNTYDFKPSIKYLEEIHQFLFRDILIDNGCFREYNLTKKETILNGLSVEYAHYLTIRTYLGFEFEKIKKTSLTTLEKSDLEYIVNLTINLWQIHPFSDGNSRTVAVFIQKYLLSLGYNINSKILKTDFLYFRDALVKATYFDEIKLIYPDKEPLINFMSIVMFQKDYKLNYEDLIVTELFREKKILIRKK